MRRKWYAAAGAVTVLLMAAPASVAGTTLVLDDGTERPEPYQQWVDNSRMPTPDRRVLLVLNSDGCPRSADACASESTIWLGRPFWPQHALLHEVGHVYDRYYLTDSDRGTFSALMHDQRPWESEPAGAFGVEEAFADAYWSCSMNGRRPTVYAPSYRVPGRRGGRFQHRKICQLIRRAAGQAPEPTTAE